MTTSQGDEPDEAPDDDAGDAAPLDVAPDDIFSAAVGVPDRPGPADTAGTDRAAADAADADTPAGTSVYPEGPPAPGPLSAPTPVAAWGTPRLPPPGGQGFERRSPRTGPQPDEFGYYPDDYDLPPNWAQVFLKLAVAVVLVAALAVAGLEISDRFATSGDDDTATAEPTPTPSTEVAVYECAGDPDPVAQLPPPAALLIAGRTADSRWLAFRNPEPPPLQLWVEARDVPTFVPSTVGIVSCAAAPDEFPTPR
jgi:hypothetical protein